MKKLLLTIFAATATFAASAAPTQVWSKSVDGVFEAGKAVYNAPVTIDGAGAVIAAGIYSVDATIEGVPLEAIGNSSYIVKYAADGAPAWTVGLVGSAKITKIVTDSENNIYVAGQFADEVTFGTTSGDAIVKEGMKVAGDATVEQCAAFIAKYTPAGRIVTVRTLVPEINPALLPELDGSYWYKDGDVNFNLTDLKEDAGRIYVAATYKGVTTIDNLVLDGTYGSFLGLWYEDNRSASVFSFDSELGDPKLIDTLTSPTENGDFTDNSTIAYNVHFDVDGSNILIAYSATGVFKYQGEDLGSDPSAIFLFGEFENGVPTGKRIVPVTSATEFTFNTVSDIIISGENAYAAGSSIKVDNIIENDVEKEVKTHNVFVASVSALDLNNFDMKSQSVMDGDYFYKTNGAAITANGTIYMPTLAYWSFGVDGQVYNEFAGEGVTYTYSNGQFTKTDFKAVSISVAVSSIAMSNISETGATFRLYNDPDAAGVDDIVVDENAPAEYFNLQGVRVANPENGLYIVRQGNKVTKQIIR